MAKAFSEFEKIENTIVFASGVSNSKETNSKHFKRELLLVKTTIEKNPTDKFIYFSTTSITDATVNKNLYVQHKLKIETYIKNIASDYLILRVSNVVGKQGNEHTIVNFLVNSVKNEKPIEIWENAERNIIDIDDVVLIVNMLLKENVKNKTINIANLQSISVKKLLYEIEVYLQKETSTTFLQKGEKLDIDTFDIANYFEQLLEKRGLKRSYVQQLLYKYY